MANEKRLNTRIVQKHDLKENWEKASNFKPLKGEIIIYEDLNKIKIGDGEKTVNQLDFIESKIMTAATSLTEGKSGLVPTPGMGKQNAFLKGDGTWSEIEKGPVGPTGPQGPAGAKGEKGEAFGIKKVFTTVQEMNDFLGNEEIFDWLGGEFVLISSNLPDPTQDPDNAKLYVYKADLATFSFLTDMSGAQGIQGPKGEDGIAEWGTIQSLLPPTP